MADEDNKIVIPVEIDDSQAREQINQLSETVQRTIAKQADRAGITPEEFYRRGQAIKENVRKYQEEQANKEERGGSKAAPNLEQEVFDETNKEVGRSAEAVRLFREALHALHPALGEAGINVTEMTGLIRAATGGVVALAAAVGGLLVTALEKAGDEANNASSRLGTFAPGGPNLQQGREQLTGLRSVGRELGEFPTELANPYEQLLRINQNQTPGQQRTDSELRETLTTLVKGTQSERVDSEKAIPAITELLKNVRENGFVDSKTLKAFEDIAPRTAAAIVQELNKARPGGGVYSDREFVSATRAASGQIGLNSQKSDEDAADSISDAWHHVKVAADRLSEVSQGGHVVAATLDKFADFIDLIGAAAKRIKENKVTTLGTLEGGAVGNALNIIPGAAPIVGRAAINYFGEKPEPNVPGTNNQQQRLNDAFDKTVPTAEGGTDVKGASEQLRDAFLTLHPAVKGVQSVLEDFAKNGEEGLKIVAADANKKQAALNLAYEPAETQSKLQRDEIGVDNANLRLRQLGLSQRDVEKQQELAALAPAEAGDRTQDAYTRYRKALAKYRGEGDYEDPNADLHALQSARHQLTRARIEEKYAGDEKPKAKLAHDKLETDIRSAELEKSDASLKLAKDRAGAPISHELAQLRYAQASLDFDKVRNDLLEKILQTLNKMDQKAQEDVDKSGEGESSAAPSKYSDASSGESVGSYSPTPGDSTDRLNRAIHDAYRRQQAPDLTDYGERSRLISRDQNLRTVEGDAAERGQKPVYEGSPPPSRPRSSRYYSTDINEEPPESGTYGDDGQYRPSRPRRKPLYNDRPYSPSEDTYETGPQPQAPVPLPQPRPPEADQQSSAVATQQVAALTDTIRDLFSTLSSKLQSPQAPQGDDSAPVTGGIRGDAGTGDEEAKSEVAGLGDAAGEAKSSLSEFASAIKALSGLAGAAGAGSSGDRDEGTVNVATGGYVRGPGTTTSDSINARLSDKEFVQPADATEHYGLPFMEAVRAKQFPRFATGGLFSGMLGGMRSGVAASAPSHGTGSATGAPESPFSSMQHWGTVDWKTDHGIFKVATERDTMRHISSAAKSAKRYSTGSKPKWYGGGNG